MFLRLLRDCHSNFSLIPVHAVEMHCMYQFDTKRTIKSYIYLIKLCNVHLVYYTYMVKIWKLKKLFLKELLLGKILLIMKRFRRLKGTYKLMYSFKDFDKTI